MKDERPLTGKRYADAARDGVCGEFHVATAKLRSDSVQAAILKPTSEQSLCERGVGAAVSFTNLIGDRK